MAELFDVKLENNMNGLMSDLSVTSTNFSSWTNTEKSPSFYGDNNTQHPLKGLTINIASTFKNANPSIRMGHSIPRRLLTHPEEGVLNDGFDNIESNLLVRVGDVLFPEKSFSATPVKYVILDQLGQGTFGQVFHCDQLFNEINNHQQQLQEQEHHQENYSGNFTQEKRVAVKIVKNKPAYTSQAWVEIRVAKLLNETYDRENKLNIVRMIDFFEYKHHLCIVFEVLSINLYELLKKNQFRGLSVPALLPLTSQVLVGLGAMAEAKVIHCDLKPENLLLTQESAMLLSPHWDVTNLETTQDEDDKLEQDSSVEEMSSLSSEKLNKNLSLKLKIIDFGSACLDGEVMYSYIQSRFYRAPEVLLGLPYDAAIDMWSLGCIVAEMFLGLPIFPGVSEHNQICRIAEMLGPTPDVMLEAGKYTTKFYNRNPNYKQSFSSNSSSVSNQSSISSKFIMKTPKEYALETKTQVRTSTRYFKHSRLRDVIISYPYRKGLTRKSLDWEKERRGALVHFIHLLLQLLPHKRLTPRQALAHPFITGAPMPSIKKKDNSSSSSSSSCLSLSKEQLNKLEVDEDGYYWTPPDDDALADRALKLMKHSNSRLDAKHQQPISPPSSSQPLVSESISNDQPSSSVIKIEESVNIDHTTNSPQKVGTIGSGKGKNNRCRRRSQGSSAGIPTLPIDTPPEQGYGAVSSSLPSYPIMVPPPPILPNQQQYLVQGGPMSGSYDGSWHDPSYQVPPLSTSYTGMGFTNGSHPFSFHQGFTDRQLLTMNTSHHGGGGAGGGSYGFQDTMAASSDFSYALQRPEHHERQQESQPMRAPPHDAHWQGYANQDPAPLQQQQQNISVSSSTASAISPSSNVQRPRGNTDSCLGEMNDYGQIQNNNMIAHLSNSMYVGSPGGHHPIWGSPMTAGHYGGLGGSLSLPPPPPNQPDLFQFQSLSLNQQQNILRGHQQNHNAFMMPYNQSPRYASHMNNNNMSCQPPPPPPFASPYGSAPQQPMWHPPFHPQQHHRHQQQQPQFQQQSQQLMPSMPQSQQQSQVTNQITDSSPSHLEDPDDVHITFGDIEELDVPADVFSGLHQQLDANGTCQKKETQADNYF